MFQSSPDQNFRLGVFQWWHVSVSVKALLMLLLWLACGWLALVVGNFGCDDVLALFLSCLGCEIGVTSGSVCFDLHLLKTLEKEEWLYVSGFELPCNLLNLGQIPIFSLRLSPKRVGVMQELMIIIVYIQLKVLTVELSYLYICISDYH